MLRFFTTAFVLFAVILSYLNLSMIWPLNIANKFKILFSIALLIIVCKDFILRLVFSGGMFTPDAPRWVIIAGSVMYAFIIIALFLLFIKDLAWLACKLLKIKFNADLASRVVIFIALCFSFYGTWEAVRVPDVKYQDFYINNLSPELEDFKIALLVDIHASSLNRREFVQAVVDKTNALEPDLILIPGDFVDGSVEQRKDDLEPLKDLRAKFGVLGTSGNHEYYSGYDRWFDVLESFGINMLENESVIINNNLIIAGVPDEQGKTPGFGFSTPFPAPDLNKALKNITAVITSSKDLNLNLNKALDDINLNNLPVILMKHRPSNARENAKFKIDLQVSGHTHGGQMPGLAQIIQKFNKGYVKGWYDVKAENHVMKLYVSPGTSQWGGFPVRIFDNSEITLFRLKAKN